jgi:hypothetical protein
MLQLVAANPTSIDDVPEIIRDAFATAASLPLALSKTHVRQVCRKVAGDCSQTDRDAVASLCKWSGVQEHWDMGSDGGIGSAQPVPSAVGPSQPFRFEWQPPVVQMVCHSLKVAESLGAGEFRDDESIRESFHLAALDEWARKHKVIEHDASRRLGNLPESKQGSSKCRHAGFCYCDDKALSAFRDALVTVLKVLHEKKKGKNPYKHIFEEGSGVLLLEWFNLEIDDAQLRRSEWIYFPYTNQSSWASVAWGAVPDMDVGNNRRARVAGNIALKLAVDTPLLDALDLFERAGMSVLPASFQGADLLQLCCYTLFTIVSDAREVPDFVPAEFEVRRFGPCRRTKFWEGSEAALLKAERQQRKKSESASKAPTVPAPSNVGTAAADPLPLADDVGLQDEAGDGNPDAEDEVDAWGRRMENATDTAVQEEPDAGGSGDERDDVEGYGSDIEKDQDQPLHLAS